MSSAAENSSHLPIATPERTGLITYDAKGPDIKSPPIEQLRPPKGASNLPVILIDDTGFGSLRASRGTHGVAYPGGSLGKGEVADGPGDDLSAATAATLARVAARRLPSLRSAMPAVGGSSARSSPLAKPPRASSTSSRRRRPPPSPRPSNNR